MVKRSYFLLDKFCSFSKHTRATWLSIPPPQIPHDPMASNFNQANISNRLFHTCSTPGVHACFHAYTDCHHFLWNVHTQHSPMAQRNSQPQHTSVQTLSGSTDSSMYLPFNEPQRQIQRPLPPPVLKPATSIVPPPTPSTTLPSCTQSGHTMCPCKHPCTGGRKGVSIGKFDTLPSCLAG